MRAMNLIPEPHPHRLSARRRFGGYRREHERMARNPDLAESEGVRRILRAWNDTGVSDSGLTDDYLYYLDALKGLHLEATDIERFSLMLVGLQHERGFFYKAGLFLSVLMNNGTDSDYEIDLRQLECPLEGIGYFNGKNIIVQGDVGYYSCSEMSGGCVTIIGDAGDQVGNGLEAGSITICGNVGDLLGSGMRGGSITIEGDAGNGIGYEMKSGEITVHGDVGGNACLRMLDGTVRIEGDAGIVVLGDGWSYDIATGERIHDPMKCWPRLGGKIFVKGEPIVS